MSFCVNVANTDDGENVLAAPALLLLAMARCCSDSINRLIVNSSDAGIAAADVVVRMSLLLRFAVTIVEDDAPYSDGSVLLLVLL